MNSSWMVENLIVANSMAAIFGGPEMPIADTIEEMKNDGPEEYPTPTQDA